MVKRTSFEHDDCPIARSLDAIGDWWSMLIIREALFGVSRFGEFQKRLGLAKNILTVRLRALVDQGILKTAPASDGSAYQEYLLTPKGRGVFPILVALRQWSEEFDERPEEIATILVDKEKGRPVRKLELHSQDGRLLSAGDTALKPRPAGSKASALRRNEADACSRQLVLAPGAQPFFRLELRHAEQMAEHLQPMALRQLDQFGNGLRNEGHGLVGAALLTSFSSFYGWRFRVCPKPSASGRLQLLLKKFASHRITNIVQK